MILQWILLDWLAEVILNMKSTKLSPLELFRHIGGTESLFKGTDYWQKANEIIDSKSNSSQWACFAYCRVANIKEVSNSNVPRSNL